MSSDEGKKPAEIGKLVSDLATAKVELLSAQCAVDRLKQQYSLEDIARLGERRTLERAISAVRAMERFFSQLELHLRGVEEQGG